MWYDYITHRAKGFNAVKTSTYVRLTFRSNQGPETLSLVNLVGLKTDSFRAKVSLSSRTRIEKT